LECAEIRNLFVAGRVPAGPDVDAHVRVCGHCGELFAHDAQLGRRLADGVLPEMEPGDLFALIDRDVQQEVGLRARLRALPTRVRAGALLGIAGALLAYQLRVHLRSDFAAFSAVVFWGVASLLTLALVAGAVRLLRGPSAPLGAAGRERGLALALLVLPALALLVVPFGSTSPEAAAWGNPSACFTYGAALVAPLLLLFWLFERRDVVPVTALVSAGALAGIAANLLLHAHCPSAHLGHLLLGHASIGVVWALALGLLSRPFQRSG
jgi:hypothetical protein